MKRIIGLYILLAMPLGIFAQLGKDGGLFKDVKIGKIDLKKHIFVHGTTGNSATNLGIQYRFGDSKKSKVQVLLGVRSTFQSANSANFVTAPANYRVGSNAYMDGFKKPVNANMDTVTIANFRNIALNGNVCVGVRLFDILGLRAFIEANADLGGINFGTSINSSKVANTVSTNYIQGGAHDIGNLNSELLLRVGFDKISIHMGYGWNKRYVQVASAQQNFPNGSNDYYRFTTKNTVFGIRYRI